jgi:hypothetical protein
MLPRFRVYFSWFFSLIPWLFLVETLPVLGKDPIIPREGVIRLFNGKDLNGLSTWLKESGREDPKKVFSVTEGMLRISGDGLGYIRTNEEYANYHLIVEYRWGTRTWGHRIKRARDSGIMVHCQGQDGSWEGIFMASIEAQIIQGGTGDFIICPGRDAQSKRIPVSLAAETTRDRDGEPVWHRGGERKTFTEGRINWFGRDPDWRDELDYRGTQDVESPKDQWTRQEVICQGGRILQRVNGVEVNEGFDAVPSAGKILLQCELAEIFFRRWELWPLGKAPQSNSAITVQPHH